MLTDIISQADALAERKDFTTAISSVCFVIKVLFQASKAQLEAIKKEDLINLWARFAKFKEAAGKELQQEYLNYLLGIYERYIEVTNAKDLIVTITAVQNEIARISTQSKSDGISLLPPRTAALPPVPSNTETLEALKHLLQVLRRLERNNNQDLIAQQHQKIDELLSSYYIKVNEVMLPEETQLLHSDLEVSQKQGLAQFRADLSKIFIALERRLSFGLYALAWQVLSYRPNPHHAIGDFNINELLEKAVKLNQKILERSTVLKIGSQQQDYRRRLKFYRSKIKASAAKADIMNVQKQLSTETQGLLEVMINHTENIVGQPPCSYFYALSGSHALEAAAFMSDIEGWLVLSDMSPSTLRYWSARLNVLSLEMEAVGEGDEEAIGLHFDAFPKIEDAGSYIRGVYTVESYLAALSDEFLDVLAEDNQRVYPKQIAGDENLYNRLITSLQKVRSNNMSWHEMLKRSAFNFTKLALIKDNNVTHVDLKKDCMQPVAVSLVQLRYYLQLPDAIGRHPILILKALVEHGFFDNAYVANCIETLSLWYRQRIDMQITAYDQKRVATDVVPYTPELRLKVQNVVVPMIALVTWIANTNNPSMIIGVNPLNFPEKDGTRLSVEQDRLKLQQRISTFSTLKDAKTKLRVDIQFSESASGTLPDAAVNTLQSAGWIDAFGNCLLDKGSELVCIFIGDEEYLLSPVKTNALFAYAGLSLAQLCTSSVMPPFHLVRLSVGENGFPAVIYPSSKGQTLNADPNDDFMRMHRQNPRIVSELLLLTLLLNPLSQNINQFILFAEEIGGQVFPRISYFGNDWGLAPAVVQHNNQIIFTLQTILIFCDVIKEQFSSAIAKELLVLDPVLLLQKWLNQLGEFQENARKLFSNQELQDYFTSSLSLSDGVNIRSNKPFNIPFDLMEQVVNRFIKIQQVLKCTAQLSCLDLIQAVEPLLGRYGQLLLKEAPNYRERARLLPRVLVNEAESHPLTHRVYWAMQQSGSSQVIYRLHHLHANPMAFADLQEKIMRFVTLMQRSISVLNTVSHTQASLFDFNELTPIQRQYVIENFDWHCLKDNTDNFVEAVGKVAAAFLIIRNCGVLTQKLLAKALDQAANLSDLVLEYIRELEGKGLIKLLAKKAPRLKNMSISKCERITQLGDDAVLAFLERLFLDNLQQLERLSIIAPRLEYLVLRNTPLLVSIDCQMPSLKFLYISDNNVTAERLMGMIISLQAIQLQEVIVEGASYDVKQVLVKAKGMLASSKSKKGFQSVEIAKQFYESGQEKCAQGLYVEAICDLQEALRFNEIYVDSFQLLSIAYFAIGRNQEALQASNRACEIMTKNKNPAVIKQRGIVNFHLKHYQEAMRDFSAAMQPKETDASLYYHRARCKFGLNDFEDAVKDLDIALNLDGKFADAFYWRGLANVKLRRTDKAMTDFDRSIQLQNSNYQIYRERAKLNFELKRLDSALNDIEQALRLNQDDANAHNLKGEILLSSGKAEVALACFTSAIKCEAKLTQAYLNAAICMSQLYRHQEAINYLDQALVIDTNCASAYLQRGIAKIELKQFEPALNDFNQAAKLMPGNYVVYEYRAKTLFALGRFEEGQKDAQYAYQLKPKSNEIETRFQSAANFSNLNNSRELNQFDQKIRSNPRDAIALNDRGLVKYRSGDYAGAITDYDAAIKINSRFENAYSNRGLACSALGNHADAIRNYDYVLSLNPNHALAMNNRAHAKILMTDYKGAILDLDKAIFSKSTEALFYFNRANAKMGLYQYDEAVIDLTSAIKFDAYHFKAYEQRGICQMRCSRLEDAKADLKKSLELNSENHSAKAQLSLIHFMTGEYLSAIHGYNDLLPVSSSMSKSDLSLWVFVRGACKGNLALFKDAIDDYNEAIHIDSNSMGPYGNRSWVKYSLHRNIDAAKDDRVYLYQQKHKAPVSLVPFILFSYIHYAMLKQEYDTAQQLIQQLLQLEILDKNALEFKYCAEIAKQMIDWLLGRSSTLVTSRFYAIYQMPAATKKIKALYCGDVMARFMFDVIANPIYKVSPDRLVGAFVEVMKIMQQALRDYPGEIKLFYYQAELFALIDQEELAYQLLRPLKLVDGAQMFNNVKFNMPTIDPDLKAKLTAALPQAGITPLLPKPADVHEITVTSDVRPQTVTPGSPATNTRAFSKPLPAPPKGALAKSPSVTASTQINPTNASQSFFVSASPKGIAAATTSSQRDTSPAVAAAAATSASVQTNPLNVSQSFFVSATPKGMVASPQREPSPAITTAASSAAASVTRVDSPTPEKRRGFFGLSRGSSGSTDSKKEKKTKKESPAIKK